jgi:non-canonical (house-cleaning) NTP pyrophosphatase
MLEITTLKPKVVICGSMHHIFGMSELMKYLEELGFETIVPEPEDTTTAVSVEEAAARKLSGNFILRHLANIQGADAVIVYNESKNGVEGYVGGNSLGEMFAALMIRVPIFYINAPALSLSYSSELLAVPHVVGLISFLEAMSKLPKVLVATTSQLKLNGVRLGFRTAGILVAVYGTGADSGVSNQPVGWDETERGANHRLAEIGLIPGYNWYVGYEGGLLQEKRGHKWDWHGIGVALVSNTEKTTKSRSIGLQYPEEMIDLWQTGQYSDLGHVAEQHYNAPGKDPYWVMTCGKYTRQQFTQAAIELALAQF